MRGPGAATEAALPNLPAVNIYHPATMEILFEHLGKK